MPSKMLTDTKVRAAITAGKALTLRDGEGLFGEVRPKKSGGASLRWIFYFKWQGKVDKLIVGQYPQVSLVEARRRRDVAKVELAADPPRNPKMESVRRVGEAQAKAQAEASEKTIVTLFDEWERVYLQKNRKDGGKSARAAFELDVFPLVGNLRARNGVLRPHIGSIIARPMARGALRTANILLALLKQYFSWGVVLGYVDVNPTHDFTTQHAGGKATARSRTLSVDELRELAQKLPASGLAEPQQAAIRLLLATAARVGELNKAHWREFDTDAGTWTIPAEHTKENRQHLVHLSDFAKAQLETLKRFRNGDHVLISARNKTPVEAKALSKVIRDRQRDSPLKGRSTSYTGALKLAGGDWAVHDLRRTAATRMSDLNVLPHVIEKCLAHKMVGVMAVYNHGEYLPERKAAFGTWGAQLERQFSEKANVVELAAHRKG